MDAEDQDGARDAAIAECLNVTLRRAARRLGAIYDAAMAPAGLNSTQARLLAALPGAGDPAPPPLHEVAARLGVEVSALTHALRPLEREGLVTLRPGVRDRRMRHAVLTGEGKARVAQVVALWEVANARVEALLGADAEALKALAGRVADPAFREAFETDG